MNYEELKRKWGRNTDGKKWILGLVVIIVVASFIVYWQYGFFTESKIEIIIKHITTNFTESVLATKPEYGENYLVSYKENNYTLDKYVFSDSSSAEKFFDEFLESVEIFIDKSNVRMDSFSGFKGKVVKPGGEEFGIIVKKGEIVIVAGSKDKNSLGKVVEWLIRS